MATALCPWRGRGDGPVAFPTFFHLRMGDDDSMVEAAEPSSSPKLRPFFAFLALDRPSVLCLSLLLFSASFLQQSSFQLCFV